MKRKTKNTILLITVFTIAIIGYITLTNNRAEIQPIIQKQFIQQISEETIIRKLHSEATLISLEGEFTKTYGKADSMFNTGWNWFDKLGSKQYIVRAKGQFTMGMDLSQITQNDILVAGSTVIIQLPEVSLYTLEIPYEDMEIINEDGLLRKEFSPKEIKLIHKEMTSIISKEVKSDIDIHLESVYEAKQFIRHFLMMLPGVTEVKFKF
jgi:hypothetical protein